MRRGSRSATAARQQRLIKTLPRKGIRFVGAVREDREVSNGSRGGRRGGAARPSLALPDKPSIAVLPFTNMSGDPEQEYFADGVAEEIITALSRCNWLFVIARNSSFTYKGKAVDIATGRPRTRRALRAGGQRAAQRQSASVHRAAH